jgi:hypothetical protein
MTCCSYVRDHYIADVEAFHRAIGGAPTAAEGRIRHSSNRTMRLPASAIAAGDGENPSDRPLRESRPRKNRRCYEGGH